MGRPGNDNGQPWAGLGDQNWVSPYMIYDNVIICYYCPIVVHCVDEQLSRLASLYTYFSILKHTSWPSSI
jgi:hypothetical protein